MRRVYLSTGALPSSSLDAVFAAASSDGGELMGVPVRVDGDGAWVSLPPPAPETHHVVFYAVARRSAGAPRAPCVAFAYLRLHDVDGRFVSHPACTLPFVGGADAPPLTLVLYAGSPPFLPSSDEGDGTMPLFLPSPPFCAVGSDIADAGGYAAVPPPHLQLLVPVPGGVRSAVVLPPHLRVRLLVDDTSPEAATGVALRSLLAALAGPRDAAAQSLLAGGSGGGGTTLANTSALGADPDPSSVRNYSGALVSGLLELHCTHAAPLVRSHMPPMTATSPISAASALLFQCLPLSVLCAIARAAGVPSSLLPSALHHLPPEAASLLLNGDNGEVEESGSVGGIARWGRQGGMPSSPRSGGVDAMDESGARVIARALTALLDVVDVAGQEGGRGGEVEAFSKGGVGIAAAAAAARKGGLNVVSAEAAAAAAAAIDVFLWGASKDGGIMPPGPLLTALALALACTSASLSSLKAAIAVANAAPPQFTPTRPLTRFAHVDTASLGGTWSGGYSSAPLSISLACEALAVWLRRWSGLACSFLRGMRSDSSSSLENDDDDAGRQRDLTAAVSGHVVALLTLVVDAMPLLRSHRVGSGAGPTAAAAAESALHATVVCVTRVGLLPHRGVEGDALARAFTVALDALRTDSTSQGEQQTISLRPLSPSIRAAILILFQRVTAAMFPSSDGLVAPYLVVATIASASKVLFQLFTRELHVFSARDSRALAVTSVAAVGSGVADGGVNVEGGDANSEMMMLVLVSALRCGAALRGGWRSVALLAGPLWRAAAAAAEQWGPHSPRALMLTSAAASLCLSMPSVASQRCGSASDETKLRFAMLRAASDAILSVQRFSGHAHTALECVTQHYAALVAAGGVEATAALWAVGSEHAPPAQPSDFEAYSAAATAIATAIGATLPTNGSLPSSSDVSFPAPGQSILSMLLHVLDSLISTATTSPDVVTIGAARPSLNALTHSLAMLTASSDIGHIEGDERALEDGALEHALFAAAHGMRGVSSSASWRCLCATVQLAGSSLAAAATSTYTPSSQLLETLRALTSALAVGWLRFVEACAPPSAGAAVAAGAAASLQGAGSEAGQALSRLFSVERYLSEQRSDYDVASIAVLCAAGGSVPPSVMQSHSMGVVAGALLSTALQAIASDVSQWWASGLSRRQTAPTPIAASNTSTAYAAQAALLMHASASLSWSVSMGSSTSNIPPAAVHTASARAARMQLASVSCISLGATLFPENSPLVIFSALGSQWTQSLRLTPASEAARCLLTLARWAHPLASLRLCDALMLTHQMPHLACTTASCSCAWQLQQYHEAPTHVLPPPLCTPRPRILCPPLGVDMGMMSSSSSSSSSPPPHHHHSGDGGSGSKGCGQPHAQWLSATALLSSCVGLRGASCGSGPDLLPLCHALHARAATAARLWRAGLLSAALSPSAFTSVTAPPIPSAPCALSLIRVLLQAHSAALTSSLAAQEWGLSAQVASAWLECITDAERAIGPAAAAAAKSAAIMAAAHEHGLNRSSPLRLSVEGSFAAGVRLAAAAHCAALHADATAACVATASFLRGDAIQKSDLVEWNRCSRDPVFSGGGMSMCSTLLHAADFPLLLLRGKRSLALTPRLACVCFWGRASSGGAPAPQPIWRAILLPPDASCCDLATQLAQTYPTAHVMGPDVPYAAAAVDDDDDDDAAENGSSSSLVFCGAGTHAADAALCSLVATGEGGGGGDREQRLRLTPPSAMSALLPFFDVEHIYVLPLERARIGSGGEEEGDDASEGDEGRGSGAGAMAATTSAAAAAAAAAEQLLPLSLASEFVARVPLSDIHSLPLVASPFASPDEGAMDVAPSNFRGAGGVRSGGPVLHTDAFKLDAHDPDGSLADALVSPILQLRFRLCAQDAGTSSNAATAAAAAAAATGSLVPTMNSHTTTPLLPWLTRAAPLVCIGCYTESLPTAALCAARATASTLSNIVAWVGSSDLVVAPAEGAEAEDDRHTATTDPHPRHALSENEIDALLGGGVDLPIDASPPPPAQRSVPRGWDVGPFTLAPPPFFALPPWLQLRLPPPLFSTPPATSGSNTTATATSSAGVKAEADVTRLSMMRQVRNSPSISSALATPPLQYALSRGLPGSALAPAALLLLPHPSSPLSPRSAGWGDDVTDGSGDIVHVAADYTPQLAAIELLTLPPPPPPLRWAAQHKVWGDAAGARVQTSRAAAVLRAALRDATTLRWGFAAGARAARTGLSDYAELKIIAREKATTALRREHCRAEEALRAVGGDVDALPTPDWHTAVPRTAHTSAGALEAGLLVAQGAAWASAAIAVALDRERL